MPLVRRRVGTRVLASVNAPQSRMELGLFAAEGQELGVWFCSSLVDSELHGGHRITTHATYLAKVCGLYEGFVSVFVGVEDRPRERQSSPGSPSRNHQSLYALVLDITAHCSRVSHCNSLMPKRIEDSFQRSKTFLEGYGYAPTLGSLERIMAVSEIQYCMIICRSIYLTTRSMGFYHIKNFQNIKTKKSLDCPKPNKIANKIPTRRQTNPTWKRERLLRPSIRQLFQGSRHASLSLVRCHIYRLAQFILLDVLEVGEQDDEEKLHSWQKLAHNVMRSCKANTYLSLVIISRPWTKRPLRI